MFIIKEATSSNDMVQPSVDIVVEVPVELALGEVGVMDYRIVSIVVVGVIVDVGWCHKSINSHISNQVQTKPSRPKQITIPYFVRSRYTHVITRV